MSAPAKKIEHDLKFCQELMQRIINDYGHVGNYTTQSDIIRLRRELNTVRKELEWWYAK